MPNGVHSEPLGPGGIYHEKQIGSLCAVHAMNNLLQKPLFTPSELGEVGRQLDARERELLSSVAVVGDKGYSNVRADGYFNVQVITAAMRYMGFRMERCTKDALPRPEKQVGFICNKKKHWFSLRRIGQEWFNLNSSLRTPKHFTDRQLASYIHQTLSDGYTVFNVTGVYPPCELEVNSQQLLEAVRGCGGQGWGLWSTKLEVDPKLLADAKNDSNLALAIGVSLSSHAEEIKRRRLEH